MNIRQQLQQRIQLLNEEDKGVELPKPTTSAGRGRQTLQVGKGLRDAFKNATTSIAVDYLNRPPPRAEFDAMNYYTIDLRLTPQIAITLMQAHGDVYQKAAEEAVAKYITDSSVATASVEKSTTEESKPDNSTESQTEESQTGESAPLNKITDPTKKPAPDTPNDIRVKAVIEKAFKDKMGDYEKRAKKSKIMKAFNAKYAESMDKFDSSLVEILEDLSQSEFPSLFSFMLSEASSEEDIIASKEFLKKHNIRVGQKIEYITNSGKKINVVVKALPNEKSATGEGEIPENSMQVSPEGSNKIFAANIIKNGKLVITMPEDSVENPTEEPSVENEKKSESEESTAKKTMTIEWDEAWNKMTLKELLAVPELLDIADELPSFFIGGEPGTVCIVSTGGFVATVTSALESAFRGAIKNGVTLEELIGEKFGKKVVNPEVGAFINKIQDPTSNKPIDFRSWNESDLEILHNIIMHTFADSELLKSVSTAKEEEKVKAERGTNPDANADKTDPTNPTTTPPAAPAAPTSPTSRVTGTSQFGPNATPPQQVNASVDNFDKLFNLLYEEIVPPTTTPAEGGAKPAEATKGPTPEPPKGTPKTLKGLVLYMTQEDFDKFTKGGQGFKNLAKGLGSELSGAVKVLNV
jgi:hypothetical protein